MLSAPRKLASFLYGSSAAIALSARSLVWRARLRTAVVAGESGWPVVREEAARSGETAPARRPAPGAAAGPAAAWGAPDGAAAWGAPGAAGGGVPTPPEGARAGAAPPTGAAVPAMS